MPRKLGYSSPEKGIPKGPDRDRTGDVHGCLTVLGLAGYREGGTSNTTGWTWLCRCSCGTEKVLQGSRLRNAKSCGCRFRERQQDLHLRQRRYAETTITAEYAHHVNGCRGKHSIKRPVPLSRADWETIVFKPCLYCGTTGRKNAAKNPQTGHTHGMYKAFSPEEVAKYDVQMNGVDRRDSSRGYELDNCVPCCSNCNFMKSDQSLSGFVESAQSIVKHLASREGVALRLELARSDDHVSLTLS